MTRTYPIVPRNRRTLSYIGPWENREGTGPAAATRRWLYSQGDGGTGPYNGVRMLDTVRIVGVTTNMSKQEGTDFRAVEVGVFIDPVNYYPQETPAARVTVFGGANSPWARGALHVDPVVVPAGSLIQVDALNYWKSPSLEVLETAMQTENSSSITLDLMGIIAVVIEQ